MKKLIGIILVLSIISGCVPAVTFAKYININVNEPFDNIATNGQPENILIKNGLDSRVVERKGTDKALYAKADGNPVKISVPAGNVYSKTVFYFDIRVDGSAVKGEALSLSGSKVTNILNFTPDRKVCLEDGMDISGYSSGKWTSYAAVVDFDNNTYDLWVDGKLKFAKRLFYSDPSKPKKIDFNFSCLNEGDISEVYLDNIFVYEGDKPVDISKIPSKGKNSEVLDFNAAQKVEKVYDTVFVDSNSKQGIGKFSLVQKADTIAEWAPLEKDGTPYIHFVKNGSNDVYGDLTPDGLYEGLDKYVYQADIYIVANQSNIVFGMANDRDAAIDYSNLLLIKGSGGLYAGDVSIGASVELGKWVNIAVAVDLMKESETVYVNGKMVAEDVPLHNGAVLPKYIRIGYTSGSSQHSEYYINKIKLYDGNSLRTFKDDLSADVADEDFFMAESMKRTTNETDVQAKELLGTDIAFMATNGKFYAKGEKYDYSLYGQNSYIDGNKLMTDVKVLEFAFDMSLPVTDGFVEVNGKKIETVKKDGADFADSIEFAEALSKLVHDEIKDREYIIISDTNKGYSNSRFSYENQEPVDLLWRYLQFDRPTGEEIFADIKNGGNYKNHPRLLIKKDEIAQFRERINKTPRLKTILNSIMSTCDTYFEKPPLERVYQADGLRIFSVCAGVKYRLFDLCTVYLATGDKKYAERAWIEMENALNWSDWNLINHFLDSGEIGPGIAFAYDTLYDYLTDEQKAFIRQKVCDQYLDYCVGVYTGNSSYRALEYRHVTTNWGAVTGASMLMMALAFIDEEPEDSLLTQKCKYIITNALQTFEHLATGAAPEGHWFEGMVYYEYVQQHFGWVLESLDNMTGKDYNFLSSPGLANITEYVMFMSTKNGSFNKSDTTGTASVFSPESFIYAKLSDRPEMMGLYADYRTSVNMTSFLPQYLLFYDPDFAKHEDNTSLPLDRYYSSYGVGVMRSSWTNTDGLYVGISGGYTTQWSDSHYDKGSFIFESQGIRWSVDMGRNGNDTMPFLKRAETHSALVINPTEEGVGQAYEVNSEMIKSESKPKGAYMIYDFTNIYGEWVNDYKRGFMVSDDRNTLTVRDELELKSKSDLKWNMITYANIEIAPDGKSAILTRNGKKLQVTGYCSANDWNFEIAEDLAPTGGWKDSSVFTADEKKRYAAGAKKLILSAKADGKVDIAVKLSPVEDGTSYAPVENIPMSAWTIPDGELIGKPQADIIYVNGKPIETFVPGVKTYDVACTYGAGVPYVSATASSGTVEISQSPSFADRATVTVTNEKGEKAVYSIGFVAAEIITDGLLDTEPIAELPSNMKLLDIASVRSDSEPQPENAAVNVADGNLNTRWSSSVKGAFVEVDLGKVYDLSGIALGFLEGDVRNYKYDILVSEDKIGYTRIFSGFSAGGTLDYEFLPANVKARYVRYVGYGHKTESWNSITEVRPVISE